MAAAAVEDVPELRPLAAPPAAGRSGFSWSIQMECNSSTTLFEVPKVAMVGQAEQAARVALARGVALGQRRVPAKWEPVAMVAVAAMAAMLDTVVEAQVDRLMRCIASAAPA